MLFSFMDRFVNTSLRLVYPLVRATVILLNEKDSSSGSLWSSCWTFCIPFGRCGAPLRVCCCLIGVSLFLVSLMWGLVRFCWYVSVGSACPSVPSSHRDDTQRCKLGSSSLDGHHHIFLHLVPFFFMWDTFAGDFVWSACKSSIWADVDSYPRPSSIASCSLYPLSSANSSFWYSSIGVLAITCSNNRLSSSFGAKSYFLACSLHLLMNSSRDSLGCCAYTLSFSLAMRKFSAGSSCWVNLSKSVLMLFASSVVGCCLN